MSTAPEFNDLFGQDTPLGNDGDLSGVAQPISEDEIDDLLYSEEWSSEERIGRLEALRGSVLEMEGADSDTSDRNALLTRIDDALQALRSEDGQELDLDATDRDPLAHRETLSPDDDELLDLEEEEEDDEDAEETEEADLDEVLDETEWEDDDGFDPDKGVR